MTHDCDIVISSKHVLSRVGIASGFWKTYVHHPMEKYSNSTPVSTWKLAKEAINCCNVTALLLILRMPLHVLLEVSPTGISKEHAVEG